ncbi:MAG TPA: T9SS type A sorting domain-containing protein, partial [Hymenobacter sp.]
TVRLRQSQPSETFRLAVNGQVVSVAVDPDQWVLDLPTTPPVRDNTLPIVELGRLLIYPNPCRETLRLAGVPAGSRTAIVVDATGRVALKQAITDAHPQLSTASLAPGLYYLRLLKASGESVGHGQFVRE